MTRDTPAWIDALAPDDLNFVRRFILASGSLKAMATEYGVSYPTIRARLDALIGKVESASADAPVSAVKSVLRDLVQRGAIGVAEARQLAEASDRDSEAVRQSATGQTEPAPRLVG
jgi:hypothetical protein